MITIPTKACDPVTALVSRESAPSAGNGDSDNDGEHNGVHDDSGKSHHNTMARAS